MRMKHMAVFLAVLIISLSIQLTAHADAFNTAATSAIIPLTGLAAGGAQDTFKKGFSGIAYSSPAYPYESDKCDSSFHGYERCIKSRGLPGIGLPDTNFYWGECKLEFTAADTSNSYEWDANLQQKIGCQGALYGPYSTYEKCADDAIVCFCQYDEDCMEPYVTYNGEYDYTIVEGIKKPKLFVIGLQRNKNIPQNFVKTFKAEFYRVKPDSSVELLIAEDCSVNTNNCGLSYSVSSFTSSDKFKYKIYLKLLDDTGPVYESDKFSLDTLIGTAPLTPQDSNNICAAHVGKTTVASTAIYSSNSDYTTKGDIIGTLLAGYAIPSTIKTTSLIGSNSYCYIPEGWNVAGNRFNGIVPYTEIYTARLPAGGVSLCPSEVLVSTLQDRAATQGYYTKIDDSKLCSHLDKSINQQYPSISCIAAGKTWCSKAINKGYCGAADSDCVSGYSSKPRVLMDSLSVDWQGDYLVIEPAFESTNNIAAVALKLDDQQFGDVCVGGASNSKGCTFRKEFLGEFTGRTFSYEISVFGKDDAVLRVT